MFREACAEAAEIVPTQGSPSSGGPSPGTSDINLAAYAVRSRNGALRVCLINKDLFRSAQVRINVGRRFAAASILRLAAG
jgi:hypothetical protein